MKRNSFDLFMNATSKQKSAEQQNFVVLFYVYKVYTLQYILSDVTVNVRGYFRSGFVHMCIFLSHPGVSVQSKASAMCSKVNQALALYTEGPVIFIICNNTRS